MRTRRQFLATTTSLTTVGLLAGCARSPDNTDERGAENTYTASIAPVGDVAFDGVPQRWVTSNGSWADMGVALGLDPPAAVTLTDRYHTHYYDDIPGVSVDDSDMVSLYQDGVNPERFYNLDADIHVIDPNFLEHRTENISQADIEDIGSRIAPFFGNCSYAHHYEWHDDYRYYSLLGALERLAAAFKRRDRYEAIRALHADAQSTLESVVPAPADCPATAVVWGVGDAPTEFYPYTIGGGTGFKHVRDLGVRDAVAASGVPDFHGSRTAIDAETLLDIDPEVLLLRGYEDKTAAEFQDAVVSPLQSHAAAGRVTAVENGDVYRGGGLYQGPITTLVLTERLAGDLYGYDGELFDRQRVADIVAGAI
ncbi:ABC transporter substrate-binding protein [Halobacterium salinarum]|uniref:ABC-type transport system periplasmic substrate-binding protein n=1 Tax=Halobacterium salinarum (strain ATCC 33171 / DSM 3754 / JCM 8978 / NBRC 102687 / NCIMB 764 / 91-R6) TaxID=2597657 RepID=A0A4D6GZI9_HALS9|nr:ABC transporter substrate-binding protein [Halobacterium salinarum]MDL0125406.1 ABC transporter substrate-binding protein [Halobacterium salinarum]MDL0136805.1 ABC transporter substrate-binding protein [Halobacterium salinarum]MDL0140942.1 ABC transporter substrate-binding protein [Halobacterium salinarum]QCC45907.1 ABC-type transport system periplasmic substrate-binding protein [Halobacterium salinarum]TYO82165.1 iron complex transport system substrate-binding protein [Halobacterium salina